MTADTEALWLTDTAAHMQLVIDVNMTRLRQHMGLLFWV